MEKEVIEEGLDSGRRSWEEESSGFFLWLEVFLNHCRV